MSQQVVGWLQEIQDLKQQVKTAQTSEKSAHASADNWRKRYEIEAEQRRVEVLRLQATIAQLQTELDRVKNAALAPEDEVQSAISEIQTVPDLQTKLIEVWSDRNQLAQDLEAERISHNETRKTLTTALGDAVEILSSLRT
jgi:predicted RNase H-like nuclease (RuvC/YqgF family)